MELRMCIAYMNWYDPFQMNLPVMELAKQFAWMLQSEALVAPNSFEEKNGETGSKDKWQGRANSFGKLSIFV